MRKRRYDYQKAIKRIRETQPEEALLGMSGDWDNTAETVWRNGKFLINLSKEPPVAGIHASYWATPTLEMDGYKEDCFTEVV